MPPGDKYAVGTPRPRRRRGGFFSCFSKPDGDRGGDEARRRELIEAYGEGYDPDEEVRVFAEREARDRAELVEVHGEGYDPEMEARIFAEASTSGRESEKTDGDVDPSTVGFGNLRDTMALRQKQRAPPRRRKAERARRRAASNQEDDQDDPRGSSGVLDDDASLRRGTLASPRKETDEPTAEHEPALEDESPKNDEPARPLAPSRTPSPMPLERLASKPSDPPVGPENKKPLSLQPLDLGDPIRYEELRRALGVEESLSRSLDEILTPVDALPRYTSKRHNLFTPFADMPASLLLPYASYEAYGRPKRRPGEGTKENGEGDDENAQADVVTRRT